MQLDIDYFQSNDVLCVAKSLLGKQLCTCIDGHLAKGLIVETEAYSSQERACHAYNGRYTERTKVLFESGGTVYVYLCYGIHKLFNIVTNQAGVAEAVLVRALQPMAGEAVMAARRKLVAGSVRLANGPGKLSQAMGIGLQHNQASIQGPAIWIEHDGKPLPGHMVEASPRIGVEYAKADALLPWRFTIKGNRWVSQ